MDGEQPATIQDFFSDEKDSAGSSSEDEEEMFISIGGKPKEGVKKKKKRRPAGPSPCMPSTDISADEFRKYGKDLIDFIADYIEGSRDRPVNHQALPGYLFHGMPRQAPKKASDMETIYKEIKQFILPGLPQWQSPKHHALLPAGGSYASLLGSMLCDGLGAIGLSWGDCPAVTELEMLVMNWLAILIDLPREFLFFGKPHIVGGAATTGVGASHGGGGIIMSSTTEALLTVLVSAKRTTIELMKQGSKMDRKDWEIQDKLTVYCSEQAHPCLERVAEVAGVRLKRLWTDKEGIMHCNTLKFAIEKDRQKGYFPCLVIGTMGTIASASVDQIAKIGPLLDKETPKVWFHIEAGYAGNSFICREYQPLLHGVDYADSFSMSAHRWLPVHMDCTCLWVKRINYLTLTFSCEDPDGPLYIPPDDKNMMVDYRQWSLPMTRRFRAIKLWMVFKLHGVSGLQQKIREDVRRAKEFEKLVGEDHRYEVIGDVMFGVVAFRCRRPDSNDINIEILKQINKSAVIKMTGARVGHKYWLRFVVSGRYTDGEDIKFSWDMIRRTTNKVITDYTERLHREGRYGQPNYKYVQMIGHEKRLDNEFDRDSDMDCGSERTNTIVQSDYSKQTFG